MANIVANIVAIVVLSVVFVISEAYSDWVVMIQILVAYTVGFFQALANTL